jgi:hypothetical protein
MNIWFKGRQRDSDGEVIKGRRQEGSYINDFIVKYVFNFIYFVFNTYIRVQPFKIFDLL